MIYIVMGVSGSGKTTFGELLAREKDIPFIDADDVHPAANIEKMRKGIPLGDEDRLPWLKLLADLIHARSLKGVVLACSALKESYRKILLEKVDETSVRFIHLKGSFDTVSRMIAERGDHFFPPSLLESQFEALEDPRQAVVIDLDVHPRFSEIIKIIP